MTTAQNSTATSNAVAPAIAIRNEFNRLYGHTETVYADEKTRFPLAFAEWDGNRWTKWLYRETESELVKLTRHLFPHMAKITDPANQAMREIIANCPMTHESDWNVSTASIPLADGDWSVSFEQGSFAQIVPTNKEHRMLNRLPVSKADLERAADEFEASQLRGFLIDWFQQERNSGIDNSIAHGLQKLMGQAIAGNPESIIMLWIGNGKNGKSQLLKFVKAALGDYATPMNVDDYVIRHGSRNHPEGLMCLRTTRIGFIGELESPNTMLAGGQLKTHTGGDAFKARGMGQGSQEMTSNTSFVVFGNHDPRIDDTSDGMERRVKYIEFANTIPDSRLINKMDMLRIIDDEKHIMLHWMLEGAKFWAQEGLGDLGMIDVATENYFAEEDVLTDVFQNYLVHNPGHDVVVDDFFVAMEKNRRLPPGIKTTRTLLKALRKRQRVLDCEVSPAGAKGKAMIYNHSFLPGKAPDDNKNRSADSEKKMLAMATGKPPQEDPPDPQQKAKNDKQIAAGVIAATNAAKANATADPSTKTEKEI